MLPVEAAGRRGRTGATVGVGEKQMHRWWFKGPAAAVIRMKVTRVGGTTEGGAWQQQVRRVIRVRACGFREAAVNKEGCQQRQDGLVDASESRGDGSHDHV